MPPSTPNAATSSARRRRCARIVAGDAPCASRSNSSPRSSRTSPTTESSKPDEREQQRDRRRAGEREQRAARERVGVQVRERVGARRRPSAAACAREVAAALVRRQQTRPCVPSPGERRVEHASRRLRGRRRRHRRRSTGSAAIDADDARRDLLAFDLQRDDPVRSRLRGDARRREHGQRLAVGRLPRAGRSPSRSGVRM